MHNFKNVLKDIHNFLDPEINTFKSILTTFLDSEVTVIKEVKNFIEKHPGKLLRPILTILTAKIFNYSGKHHISLAAAVECIHIATLLHDDVIDNSKMRHNLPTVNILWNNTTSILMGDFFFSKSFQLMVNTNKLEILKILSAISAIIVQGELKQLENISNINISLSTYFNIITSKTACLFETATHVGSLIATKKKKHINLLKEIGINFGLAYQILDDINDYSFEKQPIGKNPGDDLREGKITLPVILALENMNIKEKIKLEDIIKKENKTQDDIETVLSLLIKYNTLEKSKKYAQKYIILALNRLNLLETSTATEKLIKLVSSLQYI